MRESKGLNYRTGYLQSLRDLSLLSGASFPGQYDVTLAGEWLCVGLRVLVVWFPDPGVETERLSITWYTARCVVWFCVALCFSPFCNDTFCTCVCEYVRTYVFVCVCVCVCV